MRVTVFPGKARGTVAAPPSKSLSHRLLIGAALAKGESRLSGFAPSEDVSATADCLRALGARIRFSGEEALVRGMDLAAPPDGSDLDCRESGSTLRFLLPVAALREGVFSLAGSPRLLSRGVSVYETALARRGVFVETCPREGCVRVRGRLTPGVFELPGDLSSQYVSGLLFALPCLDGESRIHLVTRLESAPYVDLTLAALTSFGVAVSRPTERDFIIPGGQTFRPLSAAVEGDWSNAAFPLALSFAGGEVTVTGLREDSAQGDRVVQTYFEALRQGDTTLDVADCPDLAPILMTAAALSRGATLTGTKRLRIKESDRGNVMAEELLKCGVSVELTENSIRVRPGALHAPKEDLSGHNDHRVVMALTVLLTALGGSIRGAEAVRKSWPDFFETMKKVGVKTVETDEG